MESFCNFVYKVASALGHEWTSAITREQFLLLLQEHEGDPDLVMSRISALADERHTEGMPWGITSPNLYKGQYGIGYSHTTGTGRLRVGAEGPYRSVVVSRPAEFRASFEGGWYITPADSRIVLAIEWRDGEAFPTTWRDHGACFARHYLAPLQVHEALHELAVSFLVEEAQASIDAGRDPEYPAGSTVAFTHEWTVLSPGEAVWREGERYQILTLGPQEDFQVDGWWCLKCTAWHPWTGEGDPEQYCIQV